MTVQDLMARFGWTEQQARAHLAQRQQLARMAAEQHRQRLASALAYFTARSK